MPSLHEESMMAASVVIGEDSTLGLHLSYTTPLNADFDGDEGTIHVGQIVQVLAEATEIMHVKNCIMSSEDNSTGIGVVFDVILGAGLLTLNNPKFTKDQFFQYIYQISNPKFDLESLRMRAARQGIELYSGYGLFSALLPEDFNYVRYFDDKPPVIIQEGILKSGFITKPDIGPYSRNSVIEYLFLNYNSDTAAQFLTDSAFVINNWLSEYGFSIGYKDLSVRKLLIDQKTGKKTYEEICKKMSDEEVARIKLLIESFDVNFSNPLEKEKAEQDILAHLGEATAFGNEVVRKELPLDNNLGVMVAIGSKGSTFNISQLLGLVGSQTVQGKRLKTTVRRHAKEVEEGGEKKVAERKYVSTIYSFDGTPEDRGLITNSFVQGLDPQQYVAHQTASREGLTDTAQSTADIGSTNHDITRALEDLSMSHDGSIRNTRGKIYQFEYQDGFDPAKLQHYKTPYGNDVISFINFDNVIQKLNADFGFGTLS